MADFTQIIQEINDDINTNGVGAITGAKMNTVLKDMMLSVNTEKQDAISDLGAIRSGATAGATAYQKPSTGIPKTDLASDVQTSIEKADTAFQKPSDGIPASDLAQAVQTSLGNADTAVQQVTVGTTTTGNAGTNASVTNSGTVTNPVLDFTIPRGADGADGQDGADAVNPFKGWWPDLATLKAAHTAIAGDSAYVKDASPATTWSIYVYDSTASSDNYWADSGTDADTSNVQTFASGEEVNEVGIDDEPTAESENLVRSGGVFNEIKSIKGEEAVKFDFSSGSTSAYSNRFVNYTFENGKKYRIVVNTSNSDIVTYFSLRDSSGNTVAGQNLLIMGSGERFGDIDCVGDASRLYLSYESSGPSIVYNVTVYNLTDDSLATISSIKTRIYTLENKSEVVYSYTSPASGAYIGCNISRVIAGGDKLLLRVETDSSDEYYINLYKSGSSVQSVVASDAGSKSFEIIANADADEIRFRLLSVSSQKLYKIYVAGFTGYMAAQATDKADTALNNINQILTSGQLSINTVYTSPSSGTYKGININRAIKEGDKFRINVQTESTDEYYINLYSGETNVQSVVAPAKGDGVYDVVANQDADSVRFRIYTVSGSYEYLIQISSNEMGAVLSALDEIENITDNYLIPVPEYANQQKERILNIIRSLSGHELVIIGFNTDQHLTKYVNPNVQYYPIARGLNALHDMAEAFPFDILVLGGDEAAYDSTTIETVMRDINDVIKATDSYICPVIAMAGNHDAGQNYSYINADGYMEFNSKTKRNVVRNELINYGKRSTNFYYDDIAHKIRYVFIDMWSKNQTEMIPILTEALNDNKLKNSDWGVMLFSHNVIKEGLSHNNEDPVETSYPDIWTVISSFITNGGKVIACINGHCHKDVQDVYNDIPFIATTCACNSLNTSFDGNTYPRVPNTPTETAFDVYIYDKTNQKLFVLRYGAGMDRVFNLASGNVGLLLVNVYGTVTGASIGDIVKISHNNTVYSQTLNSEMTYDFQYVCPGLGDWEISVEHSGNVIYNSTVSPTLTDTSISKNITIN